MPYDPNIPQPNDLLSESQGDILDNFQTANTVYGTQHYPFDDATLNVGKHKWVGMPVTTTPATLVGEGALYFKTGTSGTSLFMVRDNDLGTDVQLTSASVGVPLNSQNGYTWLPGGLFIQWGLAAISAGQGSKTIAFNVPFASPAYNVQITPVRSATNVDIVYMVSTTANNFTCFTTSGGGITQIYWSAIGSKP